MVDIKVSMEKNAVDSNGLSLSVTSSSGASGRGGKKDLAGRGVLVLTYGRFRVEDDRTMMYAIGNEVGQPFRGHAVMLNVTRGTVAAVVADDSGSSDDDRRRKNHKNITARHDGVLWKDGLPGAGDDTYVMRPLDYRDDLRLTLCAENPKVLSVFHANAARRNMPTWLSWLKGKMKKGRE
ncbi:hypothetical protein KEM54_004089 [Ascosphaera aggregata]|nr:hypothetical protein KEM54_004089 [Ascosphaera aggregata]